MSRSGHEKVPAKKREEGEASVRATLPVVSETKPSELAA